MLYLLKNSLAVKKVRLCSNGQCERSCGGSQEMALWCKLMAKKLITIQKNFVLIPHKVRMRQCKCDLI